LSVAGGRGGCCSSKNRNRKSQILTRSRLVNERAVAAPQVVDEEPPVGPGDDRVLAADGGVRDGDLALLGVPAEDQGVGVQRERLAGGRATRAFHQDQGRHAGHAGRRAGDSLARPPPRVIIATVESYRPVRPDASNQAGVGRPCPPVRSG
jgi:hypothetical protein